jgi:hypothetical protein
VARFPIRLGDRSRALLLIFGVRDGNAYVDLDDGVIDARFGFFRIRTAVDNITRWQIEGPWRWITAIGVRRGIRHGDITFAGNHRTGVRLDFREPVHFGPLRPPRLYVSVADADGLAAALAERGIPGQDVRAPSAQQTEGRVGHH